MKMNLFLIKLLVSLAFQFTGGFLLLKYINETTFPIGIGVILVILGNTVYRDAKIAEVRREMVDK
jgi:hypothetical protein